MKSLIAGLSALALFMAAATACTSSRNTASSPEVSPRGSASPATTTGSGTGTSGGATGSGSGSSGSGAAGSGSGSGGAGSK